MSDKHKDKKDQECQESEKQIDQQDQDQQDDLKNAENDPIQELEEKIKTLEDKNLRLLAEFNNYKKRSADEYNLAQLNAKVQVIKEVLDTVDNFERALLQECKDQDFKSGMQMIYDKLFNTLTNLGLNEVDTSSKLDPNLHQALSIEQNADLEDDQIVEVLQKGYMIEEKLIRPAMVKVNKKPSEEQKGEKDE